MRRTEIQAKTILVASKLPDSDYVINPYFGCSFACAYCYATFMGRFVGEPIEAWGDYLSVKVNAVERLRVDLNRLPKDKRRSTILLSSVTDAWQGPEKKYRLARGIIETLSEFSHPGLISIFTKSPLILRDRDVIAALAMKEVGVTITTTDDAIGAFMEERAPTASDRLRTLTALNAANIPTYAFIGPLLPHSRYRRDLLEELFLRLQATGARTIYAEHLNISNYIRKRIDPLVARASDDVRSVYMAAATDEHRRIVSDLIMNLVAKYGFEIRHGKVLDHHRDKKQT